MKKFDDRIFLAVYVASDSAEARKHAIIRGGSDAEGAIFDKRRAAEDEQFTRFEKEAKACGGTYRPNCQVMWVNNDYTKDCMENAVRRVATRYWTIGEETML